MGNNVNSPRVMMVLGKFSFSVDTVAYNSLKREASWNWTEQERLCQRDILQYTGKKSPTRTFDGEAHAFLGKGVASIEQLYVLADKAEPLQLVSSKGDVMGFWVIKSVSDSTSSFMPGGTERHKTFSMTIQFYGDDISHP